MSAPVVWKRPVSSAPKAASVVAEPTSWAARYRALYEDATWRYQAGARSGHLISEGEREFLESLGGTEREFSDLVEDYARGSGWDPETALLMTAARRDYFLRHDGGKRREQKDSSTLPPKNAELDGVRWLPRIIEKARRKLQGTMNDDLMFGCGGDSGFCRKHGVDPADFLGVVRDNWDDENAILAWVREQNPKAGK